jgi:hypothetical protein
MKATRTVRTDQVVTPNTDASIRVQTTSSMSPVAPETVNRSRTARGVTLWVAEDAIRARVGGVVETIGVPWMWFGIRERVLGRRWDDGFRVWHASCSRVSPGSPIELVDDASSKCGRGHAFFFTCEGVSGDRLPLVETRVPPISRGSVACRADCGDRSDLRTRACVAPGGSGDCGGLPEAGCVE